MKIPVHDILLFTVISVSASATAAKDEEYSALRGLKAPKYTVRLNQELQNPTVFMGAGNSPYGWAVGTSAPDKNGVSVRIGLKAHAGYVSDLPQPIPGYYMVDTGVRDDNVGSKWNYDFMFDSDVECPVGNTCTPLANYVYEIALDLDPAITTSKWFKADPININVADHYFGNTDTVDGQDVQASSPEEYHDFITGNTYHVVQQSWNYAFLAFVGISDFSPLNPNNLINTEGIYDIVLSIKAKKSGALLVKTSIRVLVKNDANCSLRGKCFPTVLNDCTKANIGKFSMFFTSKQIKQCQDFVKGIKQ